VGSLQLLRSLLPSDDETSIVYNAFGSNRVYARSLVDGHLLVAVPHVSDQALFEYALADAYELAESIPAGSRKYLLLHCNYDNPFTDETSLNLTRENAEELLQVFDYILLGHEHQPREDLGGRLIIVGNPMPTSFADISNKRIIRIEDDGSLKSVPVWLEREHSWVGDWNKVVDSFLPSAASQLQFIRLVGKVEPGQLVDLGKTVRKLWADMPELLCLKVDVEVAGMAKPSMGRAELNRLPEKIAEELKGTDLEDLWTELNQ
jgi:hypothetical protein